MSDLLQLVFSFPTVVFTVPLLFSLTWFLLGLVLSGFDMGDGDMDFDLDGDIDLFDHLGGLLHLHTLGFSLSLLLLSFGGWATTLVFSALLNTPAGLGLLLGLVGLGVGIGGGVLFVWGVGGPLGRALTTETGPERDAALGCICKVRTVHVTTSFGDAEILTGPMRNSLVKVRAKEGDFTRGDMALLVELDRDADAYWIAELDEELHPS